MDFFSVLVAGFAAFVTFVVASERWKYQKSLMHLFKAHTDVWDLKLSDADSLWTMLYLEGPIKSFDGIAGQTQRLNASTIKIIEEALRRIKAMQKHVSACKRTFGRGNFLRFGPYQQALKDIDLQSKSDEAFVDLQGEMFRKARQSASALAEAGEAWCNGDVYEDFPRSNVRDMIGLAGGYNIPDQWLDPYLLWDTKDEYDALEALRQTDPMTYLDNVRKWGQAGAQLRGIVTRIIRILDSVRDARVHDVDIGNTRVLPNDDPSVALKKAQEADQKLMQILASSDNYNALKAQGTLVISLYSDVRYLLKEIQQAMTMADAEIHRLEILSKDLQIYRSGDSPLKALDKGDRLVLQAKTELSELRHLDSMRTCILAGESYMTAMYDTIRDLISRGESYA